MPKSLNERLAHDDALAELFENYEPRDQDLRDVQPWHELRRAVERRARVDREIIAAVIAMRDANWPWSDIGQLLGTSGQAAQQRYGSRVSVAAPTPGGK
jgi:hypothetical protein